MPQGTPDYLEATHHPWAGFLFVFPLLTAYEIGILGSGAAVPEMLRNGADCWLRATLAQAGVPALFGAPLLLVAILLGWTLVSRRPIPRDLTAVWVGMAVESTVFALGFYTLSKGLVPLLHVLGVALSISHSLDPGIAQILSYLGAGIYEEALFRLLLFSGLWFLFMQAEFPPFLALNLAGLGSALVFAAAHHLGPCGEPFLGNVFFFRSLAGLYFAWIFHVRGFGIAVGAHAGYDVLVGIFLPTWSG